MRIRVLPHLLAKGRLFSLENLVKIGDLCIIGVANRLGAPLTPAVRIFIACQGDGMAGNTQEMSYVPVSGGAG